MADNKHLNGAMGSRRLGDMLLLPASLCGVALLIVNDHYMKRHLHNAISGKLSDIAGLLFFPLLIATGIETTRIVLRRRQWCISIGGFDSTVVVVGIFFMLMKTWQPAGQIYVWLDASLEWPVLAVKAAFVSGNFWTWPKTGIVMDTTDLMALPALLIPWWSGRRWILSHPGATGDMFP